MAGYRENTVYDTRMRMNFNNMDDMQPQPYKIPSSGLRLYNQEYQHQETGNGDNRQTSKCANFLLLLTKKLFECN
jgi:hypothetical protein